MLSLFVMVLAITINANAKSNNNNGMIVYESTSTINSALVINQTQSQPNLHQDLPQDQIGKFKYFVSKGKIVSTGDSQAMFEPVYAGKIDPKTLNTLIAIATDSNIQAVQIMSLYRPGDAGPSEGNDGRNNHAFGKAVDISGVKMNGVMYQSLQATNGDAKAIEAFAYMAKVILNAKSTNAVITAGSLVPKLESIKGFQGTGWGAKENIRVMTTPNGAYPTGTHHDHIHVDGYL